MLIIVHYIYTRIVMVILISCVVGAVYAVGCGRSPPPAHGTSRLPGALPPLAAPGPPHASQVPREADSLQMLLRVTHYNVYNIHL